MADPKYQNPAHVVLDPGKNYTAEADGAIPGSRFVKFAAGGRPGRPVVTLATGATDAVVGSSKYDVEDGTTGGIFARSAGHTTITAGAAITAGQGVVSDSTGRAVPAGSNAPVAAAFSDAALGSDVYVQFV